MKFKVWMPVIIRTYDSARASCASTQDWACLTSFPSHFPLAQQMARCGVVTALAAQNRGDSESQDRAGHGDRASNSDRGIVRTSKSMPGRPGNPRPAATGTPIPSPDPGRIGKRGISRFPPPIPANDRGCAQGSGIGRSSQNSGKRGIRFPTVTPERRASTAVDSEYVYSRVAG